MCHCMGPSQDQSHLALSEGEGGGRRARTELPAAQELCIGTTIKRADFNKSKLSLQAGKRERSGHQCSGRSLEVIAHGGREP